MKYCNKCGYQLPDEANFCNACGASFREPQTTNNDQELKVQEQALLDKFSIGLKHERMAWKFVGIFYLIATIIIALGALFIGICAIVIDSYDSESAYFFYTIANIYFILAIYYLPPIIINFAMKKKLENYRAKLYTDCRDGIGHFSIGSIVFCAFFNGVALIFNIVYFIKAKNNTAVIERIKSRQASFNSQK